MMHSRVPFFCVVVILVCHPFAGAAASKPEDWATKQGEKFRAAPVDVLGPFALFLTAKQGGKRVVLSQLSEEDCVRFHRRITDGPQRALRWADGTSEATRELVGNVRRLQGEAFHAPKLEAVPEPEFLMLLFLSTSGDDSWQASRDFLPEYQRVRAGYPGLSEAVFIGVRHREADHNSMARQLQMPWLIEDLRGPSGLIKIRQRHTPAQPPTLMIITRTNVPMAFSACKTKSDIQRAVLEMEGLLNAMRPGNRRTWPERLYFYRTVRLASFQTGRADPMLIGHVIDLAALRESGVTVVTASLDVSAQGQVTSAAVQPGGGIDAALGKALGEALLQSAMVPAIENGQFVEGRYDFRLEP